MLIPSRLTPTSINNLSLTTSIPNIPCYLSTNPTMFSIRFLSTLCSIRIRMLISST